VQATKVSARNFNAYTPQGPHRLLAYGWGFNVRMEHMKKLATIALLTASMCAGSYVAFAGAPMQMSFFVTSKGSGKGADLGGIAGADAHCAMLAQAAGSTGKTWRAYLSTQGAGAVSARDRIGNGPWYNAKGQVVAQNVNDLHGNPGGGMPFKQIALNEKGGTVNGVGDSPNQHDMLTGSTAEGRAFTDNMDHTCNNWTNSGMGTAQLGHHDRMGGGGTSWNSQHASRGCSQQDLVGTGGAGLFYCFATN
jgi:hypothetical protein